MMRVPLLGTSHRPHPFAFYHASRTCGAQRIRSTMAFGGRMATIEGRLEYTPDDRILVARERGRRVKLADGTAGPARNGTGRAHATPAGSHPTRKRRRNMATSKKNDFMTKVGTVVDAVKDRAQEVGKSLAVEAGKAAASARTGLASASVTLGKTARVVGATAGELAASAQEKTSVAVRAVKRGVAAARAGDTPAKKPRRVATKARNAATKKPTATTVRKTAKTVRKAVKTAKAPTSAKTRKPPATKPAVKRGTSLARAAKRSTRKASSSSK